MIDCLNRILLHIKIPEFMNPLFGENRARRSLNFAREPFFAIESSSAITVAKETGAALHVSTPHPKRIVQSMQVSTERGKRVSVSVVFDTSCLL